MKALNSILFSSFLLLFFSLQLNAQQSSTSSTLPPVLPTTTTTTSVQSTSHTDTTTSSHSSATSQLSTTTSTSSTPSTSAGTTPLPVSSPIIPDPIQLTTSNGVEVTITITNSQSSSSATPSPTSTPPPEDNSGLSTGSIIGMSVAGGIALIGIVAFFVWKFTRKRFSHFDDNEAIKWPDLNTHGAGASDSHPLPVNNTGRSGFDTGSEGSLSRVPSTNYSTPDFHAGPGADPYAVPPLPHLNPNQPYRDDPGAPGAYYDPYRGPIPGTIEIPGQQWGGEVIPMTQMSAGAGGRMSPGPNAAYGAEPAYEYDLGRQSPGPNAAYSGRTSPGPQAAYGGRTSPGPQAAYGGRTSPGPQAAYGVGARTMSPGPHAAYGGAVSPAPGGYDYTGR